jgi:hypothetical protein
MLFVLFVSRLHSWKDALLSVKPETGRRRHRQGFRLFGQRKSQMRSHEPKIPVTATSVIQYNDHLK